MIHSNTILLLYASLVILIIMISSLTSRYGDPKTKRLFDMVLILQLSRLISELGFIFSAYNRSEPMYILCGIVNYLAFYGIIYMITLYFVQSILHQSKALIVITRIICFFCIVGSVLWIISLFNDMFLQYDIHNHIIPQPLYWLGQVPGWIAVILDFVIIFTNSRELGIRNVICFLTYLILPALGTLFRGYWFSQNFQSLAITLTCLLIYSISHVDQQNLLKEQEKKLADERIRVMLSQIQPHFMYNTLNTIYYLAGKNPETAQRAISEFSDYLRGNIDSLTTDATIPFDKELEHIRHYLSLEEIRFEDELQVRYEIHTKDFRVPPLTIQPLVENAVKHGVGRKPGGGTVTIVTDDLGNFIRIQVIDDGVGFHADQPYDPDDNKTHVGLYSVRERIRSMTGGTLNIKSTPGEGTSAEVILPKSFSQ